MPQFFFHIRDHLDLSDVEGIELPSAADALQEAIKTAGQIIADDHSDLLQGETWTMTVTDQAGDVVCALSFTAKGKEHLASAPVSLVPDMTHDAP